MSIAIHYIDSLSVDTELTSGREFLDGQGQEPVGLSRMPWEPNVDQFPYGVAVLNAYTKGQRPISFSLWSEASSRENTLALANAITDCYAPDVAANESGILRFVTDSDTREIAVASYPIEKTQVYDTAIIVRCAYLGLQAWFRDEADTSVNSNFNNAVPVNVACNNVGKWPAFPTIKIVGVVNTPVLTNSAGKTLTINTATVNADDELYIYTAYDETGIDYYEHGAGSAVNWTGYASADSLFWWLPTGNNNVVISAASGTAAITFSWRSLWSGIE